MKTIIKSIIIRDGLGNKLSEENDVDTHTTKTYIRKAIQQYYDKTLAIGSSLCEGRIKITLFALSKENKMATLSVEIKKYSQRNRTSQHYAKDFKYPVVNVHFSTEEIPDEN